MVGSSYTNLVGERADDCVLKRTKPSFYRKSVQSRESFKAVTGWANLPSKALGLPQNWKKKSHFCPNALGQKRALSVFVLVNIHCFTWFANFLKRKMIAILGPFSYFPHQWGRLENPLTHKVPRLINSSEWSKQEKMERRTRLANSKKTK